MKTRPADFSGASALQIILAALVLSVVAISFASLFAAPRLEKPEPQTLTTTPTPPPGLTVSLPIDTLDNQVPVDTVFLKPVLTTNIDAGLNYVGFLGDFTFDETVINFSPPFVEPAGLTADNWSISAITFLEGPPGMRTLRVTGQRTSGVTPLNGSGVLFNLRMRRVSSEPGRSTPLRWIAAPGNFFFYDDNLNMVEPNQPDGFITITGPGPTATPTPNPNPTPTPSIAPAPTPPFEGGTLLWEPFDTTVPPAVPNSWNTSFVAGAADCTPSGTCGLGTNWVTTTSNPYSGSVCAFHDAPGCVTDSVLDTRPFFLPNVGTMGSLGFSFRHSFNLEEGRDGGVVEISIDGGRFTDVREAGGFVTYNGVISTEFESPIKGRPAWTGNSGGYILSGVGFPVTARGHAVVVRFRLATDCSGSGTGWFIDEVYSYVHFAGTPPPTATPTATPGPPTPTPFAPPPVCSFDETQLFPTVLASKGWVAKNRSSPPGIVNWFSGIEAVFTGQSDAWYLAGNFNSGTGTATISNWQLTPPIILQNGATFTFWTRTVEFPIYPDRLQVRMSTNGNSAEVGTSATSVGDFTTLLLDINPDYTTSGYPSEWTKYQIVLSGLASPVTGRLAFRYFVENGGPNGTNSDYIGIDTVSYACGVTPTPTPTPAPTPTPEDRQEVFLYEDFDRTNPPALPPEWSSSFATGPADCTGQGNCAFGTNWVNSPSNPYTGPLSAFHDAPACVTDSYLDTPSFDVPNFPNLETVRVRFQHSFNLANGRDGGVLEVSYDGGCFKDIRDVGGTANYNNTISTGFLSPIAGRNAWTGNSGGYVSGHADLPESAKGHQVILRFRLATDCSGSGTGWYIDVVKVSGNLVGGPNPTPANTPMPTASPSPPATVCTSSEGFDVVGPLNPAGWVKQNNSGQFRLTDWSTGDTARFPAQAGAAPNSYVGASSSVGCGMISNWLLTPPLTLADGGVFTFWTRTVDTPIHPDRLEVRMSTNGTGANVGNNATSIGDFTALLLDINPTYTTSGYPNVWTKYTIVMNGLTSPVTGRLAFRYFVEDGGPNGTNSDYIGIDTVSYVCGLSTPTPTPGGAAQALNLSTRLLVGTGNDVGIGGFIITGTDPKQVLLRGIGPSLGKFGVPNSLADPFLELRNANAALMAFNDNWCTPPDDICNQIIKTGIPPTNDLESAIFVTLDPGAYTAILEGNNNGTGVGLVEIYDLTQGTTSKLGNISTRAFVGTGSDIVITGFILGGGSGDDAILVRGIGPSLTNFGVPNALANPTLELRNGDGALIASNDDWQNGPPVSLPHPGDPLESAIDATLPPGSYTALLSGVDNGTGVGLVEVYDLGQ